MPLIDRRQALMGTLAAGLAGRLSAQTPPPGAKGPAPAGVPDPGETIDLWPMGAPGMPARPPVETVENRSRDSAFPDRLAIADQVMVQIDAGTRSPVEISQGWRETIERFEGHPS